MSLNAEQLNALLSPINPARVQTTQGNANLEAWDVRRWLLRIFGWGGWSDDILSLECVSERSKWDDENPLKGRHTVVYRCTMRLTIKDTHGNYVTHFDDGATGDAINQPSLGDAHDQAMKTALSQALKRCAVNCGDQFGLSLYNKGSRNAVVGKSVAHVDTEEHDAREDVAGGEMDSPVETETGAVAPAPDTPAPAEIPEGVVAPEGVDAGSSSPEADVEALRERVLTAMDLPKQEAIRTYARLQLDIAKAGVQSVMVTSPAGVEMTLGALVSQALDFVSKPRQGNAAADAAAGEAKAS